MYCHGICLKLQNLRTASVAAEILARGTPNEIQARGTPNEIQARGTPNEIRARGTPNEIQAGGTPNEIRARGTPNEIRARGTQISYNTGASPLHHCVDESHMAQVSFFKGNVITSLTEKCLVIERKLHVIKEWGVYFSRIRVFRVQVLIMGSFVRCRDFKHCAQSKFNKGQESWRQFIGCAETADGKSITHLYMYITDKKQSECRS